MSVAAIIVAAGRGVRFGGHLKKQFLTIGDKPVLEWTLMAFQYAASIDEIVLVVGREDLEYAKPLQDTHEKITTVVVGGETRQESCWNGLSRLGETVSHVAVHDGVRPCVTSEVIDQTVAAAIAHRAAITGVPLQDTVARAAEGPVVGEVLDREEIWRIQTPQAFEVALLREASLKARKDGYEGTDESSLVIRLGVPVHLVHGRFDNIKITSAEDLTLVEAVLRKRTMP